MLRIEMLNQYKRHSRIRRHVLQELGERLQPARGSANTHDGKGYYGGTIASRKRYWGGCVGIFLAGSGLAGRLSCFCFSLTLRHSLIASFKHNISRGADGLAVCPCAKEAPAALADGKTVRPTDFS